MHEVVPGLYASGRANGDDDDEQGDVQDEEDGRGVEDERKGDVHVEGEPRRRRHFVKGGPGAAGDEEPCRGASPGPGSWLKI